MRGPTLETLLTARYAIVVFDKQDRIVNWDATKYSERAAYLRRLFQEKYKQHRVSVYKLPPCRF